MQKLTGLEAGNNAVWFQNQASKTGRMIDNLRNPRANPDGLGHQWACRKDSKVSTM